MRRYICYREATLTRVSRRRSDAPTGPAVIPDSFFYEEAVDVGQNRAYPCGTESWRCSSFSSCASASLGRLGFLQIAQYDYYRKKAINNQTSVIEIAPMRGSILDRNMTELAVSANVYMVVMSPVNFKDDDEKRKATAAALAQMLSLDEEAVYKKTKQNVRFTYVKRRIEKPEADQVRAYIKRTSCRAYCRCATASSAIIRAPPSRRMSSATGTDNQGLPALRNATTTAGTPGKIVTATGAVGMETTFDYGGT